MTENGSTTIIEPVIKREPERQRRPNGNRDTMWILWDDDDHSYEYVVLMMRQLFCHSFEKGFKIAKSVDNAGRAVVSTTREHAELKRDQIP